MRPCCHVESPLPVAYSQTKAEGAGEFIIIALDPVGTSKPLN